MGCNFGENRQMLTVISVLVLFDLISFAFAQMCFLSHNRYTSHSLFLAKMFTNQRSSRYNDELTLQF